MIFVGSLLFSPVYKSHCCAFGTACEEAGYSVRYLFSNEYEWMLPKRVKEKTTFIGSSQNIVSMLKDTLHFNNIRILNKAFSKYKITHVYLHNYHLLNHCVANICKKIGCKFIYHFHEPYVEDKNAHGGFQKYWLYPYEYAERSLLNNVDIIVVSSKKASELFAKYHTNFKGKKVTIPLLYEDLGSNNTSLIDRRYLTFIGPPVPAKGPDLFLKIVKHSTKCNLNWSFLLISRLMIRNHKFFNKRNLKIFFKKKISDKEFGNLIRKSLLVLTPYKRETQSSALLVSYMYGTPVVSSNVGGLSEFIIHKKTGYIIHKDASIEEWIEGINYILKNVQKISKNCRQYFVDNFSGRTWKKYLKEILL